MAGGDAASAHAAHSSSGTRSPVPRSAHRTGLWGDTAARGPASLPAHTALRKPGPGPSGLTGRPWATASPKTPFVASNGTRNLKGPGRSGACARSRDRRLPPRPAGQVLHAQGRGFTPARSSESRLPLADNVIVPAPGLLPRAPTTGTKREGSAVS